LGAHLAKSFELVAIANRIDADRRPFESKESLGGCSIMRAIQMKTSCLLLGLAVFSGPICAEQTEPCAGLEGAVLTQCRTNQQTLRQEEHLEQLIQQQQERQNELDKQQREVQQQLESMRLQNESLRKELEREAANQRARPVAMDAANAAKSADSRSAEVKSWRADNPWFGSDYVKTSFAMRYIKQLQQEHPDLAGRDLLDALSMKVTQTFGAKN
jgi:TolA-binding protein